MSLPPINPISSKVSSNQEQLDLDQILDEAFTELDGFNLEEQINKSIEQEIPVTLQPPTHVPFEYQGEKQPNLERFSKGLEGISEELINDLNDLFSTNESNDENKVQFGEKFNTLVSECFPEFAEEFKQEMKATDRKYDEIFEDIFQDTDPAKRRERFEELKKLLHGYRTSAFVEQVLKCMESMIEVDESNISMPSEQGSEVHKDSDSIATDTNASPIHPEAMLNDAFDELEGYKAPEQENKLPEEKVSSFHVPKTSASLKKFENLFKIDQKNQSIFDLDFSDLDMSNDEEMLEFLNNQPFMMFDSNDIDSNVLTERQNEIMEALKNELQLWKKNNTKTNSLVCQPLRVADKHVSETLRKMEITTSHTMDQYKVAIKCAMYEMLSSDHFLEAFVEMMEPLSLSPHFDGNSSPDQFFITLLKDDFVGLFWKPCRELVLKYLED